MSSESIGWALNHSKAKLGDLLVLVVLADHANVHESAKTNNFDNQHVAWPGVKRLARLTRLSERQVQYSLRTLEKLGEIRTVMKHASGTTIYAVPPWPEGVQILHPLEAKGVQSTSPGGVQSTSPELEVRTNVLRSNDLRTPPAAAAGNEYVKFFVDECRRLGGADPLPNAKNRIGKHTNDLVKIGVEDATIRAAITEIVSAELGVGAFPGVVDQIHRKRASGSTGALFDKWRERLGL